MSYVPPHKRINSAARPESIHNTITRPDVSIRRSTSFVGLFYVSAKPEVALEFLPFTGETYPHLMVTGISLYTLHFKDDKIQRGQYAANNVNDSNLCFPPEEGSNTFPRYILSELHPQLSRSIWSQRVHAREDEPSLTLKFGKVLFHGRKGFPLPSTIDASILENKNADLRRTFDNGLTLDQFEALKHIALAKANQVINKERFVVMVEDGNQMDYKIKLICERKHAGSLELVLQRIKSEPLRHLVADISCVGRKLDMRMMLATKRYVDDLPDGEISAFQSLISKAVVNNDVKGGLSWPMGSTHISKRFKLHGSWHRKDTIVMEDGRVWKFRHVNRAEFKASTGRISYEVKAQSSEWERSFQKLKKEKCDLSSDGFSKEGDLEVMRIFEELIAVADQAWLAISQ